MPHLCTNVTVTHNLDTCGHTSVSFPLSSTRLDPPWLLTEFRLVKLVLFIRACTITMKLNQERKVFL